MSKFWRSSGLHLLDQNSDGMLIITGDFLRAYLKRPELAPMEDSCAREISLHGDLVADPHLGVTGARISELADPDGQENYRVFLAFRAHLQAHETIERAYLALFGEGAPASIPPLFIDQLAHALTHRIIEDITDPMKARAGELLFRSQKVMTGEQGILCADEEIVDMHARSGGLGALGELIKTSDTATRNVDLDILSSENAERYWARSDRFDMVLDLSFARPGLDALSRVLEGWAARLAGLDVSIQPVRTIKDERWVWHIGLDAQSNAILNDLYHGTDVGDDRLARLISLFRMEIKDQSGVMEAVRGRPVYLGLAHSEAGILRLKPQNLIVNLPLAERL